MSPKCNNCGNVTHFKHYGNGWELREYDKDDGTYTQTVDSDVNTRTTECYECGSLNVTFDLGEQS